MFQLSMVHLHFPEWGIYGHLATVLTFFLSVLFVSTLLRSRRPPASVLAWLIAIILVPYLAIPLFIVLGRRKFRLRASPRTGTASGALSRSGLGGARIAGLLEASGAPSPCANRDIRLLETGPVAYCALIDGIRSARKRIDVSMYIFAGDETGRAILAELTKQAAAGVRVRVLVDALGFALWGHPETGEFEAAGGKLVRFMPLLPFSFRRQINLRNHRKLVLIDDDGAWFGGMNFADEYLGPRADPARWEDLAVWAEGSVVRDLSAIFKSDWEFATKGGDVAPATRPMRTEGGDHLAQVVGSGPDYPGDSLYESLLEACYEAETRIWIVSPYFIPDEPLVKGLELACKRGVDVQILVPKRSDHRLTDLARGSYLRQLQEAGGRILFHPRMVHAKMMIVDRRFALVGSANIDMRSLLYNYEIGVFLYSPDEIEAAETWQKRLATECRPAVFRESLGRDLTEGIGRLFGGVL